MKRFYCFLVAAILFCACSEDWKNGKRLGEKPVLFPDYAQTTIPYNIAPLNFTVRADGCRVSVLLEAGVVKFKVEAPDGKVRIPEKKWKRLLQEAKDDSVRVTVARKKGDRWEIWQPVSLNVAADPVDPYLVYRLIEPGYALWNKMGIYQRGMESFDETTVYENKMTDYNCVNCHSFCGHDPDKMLFHLRAKLAGTVLVDGDEVELLDTKTDKTISAFTYPYWHPSGRYIAFSINRTTQQLHSTQRTEVLVDGDEVELLDTKTDKTISAFTYPYWHPSGRYIAFSINRTTQQLHSTQRTEVYDTASDVIVYDVERHTFLSVPGLASQSSFDTFPSFSPDGKSLFYCTAPACLMPDSIGKLAYSLCCISFDPESGTFGSQVDTLFDARANGKSVSFPRVSPDGRFMLCTLSGYGTFPIWHKDADLYMIDLKSGVGSYPETLNSNDTESYHSWSSNGRWVVFSSRRLDGLYTRPFIAYVGKDGKTGKPFLLPQKEADYYAGLMKSYNIPEFVTGKVTNRSYQIRRLAEQGGISVSCSTF